MSVLPKDVLEPLPDGWRERLAARWPNGARLTAAWKMAGDIDTLYALLAGEPVLESQLDPDGLAWARESSLVWLDSPVDLFHVREAA